MCTISCLSALDMHGKKAATFYGWKQQKTGIDLITEQRKIAMELKSSVHSDSSAARRRKYDMLVEFKQKHPDHEIVYAVINDATAKDKMVHDGQVRYVSWTHALTMLFGSEYLKVMNIMEQVVEEFLKLSKLDKTECMQHLQQVRSRTVYYSLFTYYSVPFSVLNQAEGNTYLANLTYCAYQYISLYLCVAVALFTKIYLYDLCCCCRCEKIYVGSS